jgi:hypothetical protein
MISVSSEEWREVPGYEGKYWASSLGRIKSRFKVLKTDRRINNSGYKSLNLSGITKGVHVWIALSFLGYPNSNANHVNHKNGNKLDNRACNLEWISRSENMKHAYACALLLPCDRRGVNNPNAKLSRVDWEMIRDWYKTGEFTQREIALQFNIHKSQVQRIVNREF